MKTAATAIAAAIIFAGAGHHAHALSVGSVSVGSDGGGVSAGVDAGGVSVGGDGASGGVGASVGGASVGAGVDAGTGGVSAGAGTSAGGASVGADAGIGTGGASVGAGASVGGVDAGVGTGGASTGGTSAGTGTAGVGTSGAAAGGTGSTVAPGSTQAAPVPAAIAAARGQAPVIPKKLLPIVHGGNGEEIFRREWNSVTGEVWGTHAALQSLDAGIRATPGTSAAVVEACRTMLQELSAPLGAVKVEAYSAGTERLSGDGGVLAPLHVRIIYAVEDRHEVRETRISCHIDREGYVVETVAI